MALATMNYGCEPIDNTNIWINEDIAGSPPLQLPTYLKDRIESRKRKMWECKTANISLADAKRKAILDGRVRRLSDQADHVKKTVKENVEQQRYQADETIKRINARLKKAEHKRSRRLNSISIRCKKKVADAKLKRLENIQRQQQEQEERLDAINEKLAAGIARRNSVLRTKQLRSLVACRWCAARRIQLWWHIMMLKKRTREFLLVCPKELLGESEPATYYDLRRILISRHNILATRNLLNSIYKFNQSWSEKAGARILLTTFMIKYFPRSVLAYDGELERNLIEAGEQLVVCFRRMVHHPNAHYRMIYQNMIAFGRSWAQYVTALNAWKSVDIDRLLEELHRYWGQLQEVKLAMTERAGKAANTTLRVAGAQEEISDSNAVLAHIASQEQMVLDRLEQTGGRIAVEELREKFREQPAASSSTNQPGQSSEESRPELVNSEETPTPELEQEPSPEVHPGPSSEEGQEPDPEVRQGPSDAFYEDMAKMEMAHEIVMNSDYKIEKQETPGLQGQIEATMKEAFWELLRSDVENNNYKQCVVLLAEIRTQIESIGTIEKLPASHPFRVLIADTLDIPLIEQQIEHETFSLPVKVEGIVSILLKLCSAAQDQEIRTVLHLTDVVEIFKALYSSIDAIKLEIANFYLEQAKKTIKEHSVEYERAKFEEFLQTHPSGLDVTKSWIQDNRTDSPLSTMCNAYLQLLTCSPPKPETVSLDQHRFRQLGSNLRSTLLSTLLHLKLPSLHPNLDELPFLAQLRDTFQILVPWDTDPEPHRELLLHKTLDMCSKKAPSCDPAQLRELVQGCIEGVLAESEEDVLLALLKKRLLGYLTEVSLNRKPQVPRGFDACSEEVVKTGEVYLKLVDFNRRVYGPYYARIIKALSS